MRTCFAPKIEHFHEDIPEHWRRFVYYEINILFERNPPLASRTKTHFTFTFFSENESCQNSRRMTKEIYIISNSFFSGSFILSQDMYLNWLMYYHQRHRHQHHPDCYHHHHNRSSQSTSQPAASCRAIRLGIPIAEMIWFRLAHWSCWRGISSWRIANCTCLSHSCPEPINNRGHCHC